MMDSSFAMERANEKKRESTIELSIYNIFFHVVHRAKQLSKRSKVMSNRFVYRCKHMPVACVYSAIDDERERLMNPPSTKTSYLSWYISENERYPFS